MDEAVKHYTAKLNCEEAAERRLRMQDWRSRMRSGVGGQSALAQAETRLPEGASTREEACEQVRRF